MLNPIEPTHRVPDNAPESSSSVQRKTPAGRGAFRRRSLKFAGLLLVFAASAHAQLNFTTAVLTASSPQAATIIVPSDQPTLSVYDNFGASAITGPASRFYSISSNQCVGQQSGGTCSVFVVFAPAVAPLAGQTFNATLTVNYQLCQTPIAGGVATGPVNCQQTDATFSLSGTVTGSLPSFPNAQIQITPSQPVLLQAGNYGSELAKDGTGNLYASLNNTVVEFTGSQVYTAGSTPAIVAGNGGPGGNGDSGGPLNAGINPYGLAVIGSNVFAVDSGAQGEVRTFDARDNGNITLYVGIPGQTCRAIDQTYHVGVATQGVGCYSYNPGNPPSIPPTSGLFNPSALATDGLNLFVDDVGSDTIRVRSITDTFYDAAGYAGEPSFFEGFLTNNIYPGYSGNGGPANQAQLNHPTGMAVDSNAILYIADQNNSVIRKVDVAGKISTYLGQGPGDGGSFPVGLGDGLATQALLSFPVSLTFDAQGDMFIFDDGGYALREVQNKNGNTGSIRTLYSIPHSGLAPVPVSSGTPVIDSTGELLFSSYFYLPLGTYSVPTPTPGIYELLGSGVLNFPTIEIGTPDTLNVTITNPGTASLTISSSNIGGTNPNDFTISNAIGDCLAQGSIAPGASCTLSVVYNPTAGYTGSTRAATLYLSTNVGSGTQIVALNGTTYMLPTLTKAGTTYTPYYNWPNPSLPLAFVSASGGVPPYTFSMNLTSTTGDWYFNTGTTTADIAGTPLQTGSIPYTITVTDSKGGQATYSGTIAVQAAPSQFNLSASQTYSAAGTAVSLVSTLNQGETLAVGAYLPSGSVLLQQDSGTGLSYALTAGSTQSVPFNFDILYHTITANYYGDANYAAASPMTISINGNRPQSITFRGGLNAPVGSTIALTARASSGLPISYAVTSGPGSIDATGMNLVVFGTGQVQVTASQAGNNSFAAATPVTAAFISY